MTFDALTPKGPLVGFDSKRIGNAIQLHLGIKQSPRHLTTLAVRQVTFWGIFSVLSNRAPRPE